MKKIITFLMLYILLAPIVMAQETMPPRVCPTVCVEMYILRNKECGFTKCGSGCGPDNINSFKTLRECKVKIIKPIEAGITPDSPTWSLDILFEKLQILFTADKTKKIELRLRNIEERVEEIKIMVNRNKLKAIEIAVKEKEKIENKVIEETEGMRTEIKEAVLANLQKHIIVLKEVRTKLPTQAQVGIDTAIQKGERNIERFREKIIKDYVLEPVKLVCCKINPVVSPEHIEATTSYKWKTKSDCSQFRDIVGVGFQIVEDSFCKKLYYVL